MEAAKVEVSFFLSCLFPGFSILSLTPSQSTTMVSSRPVSKSQSSRDSEDEQPVHMCVCVCACAGGAKVNVATFQHVLNLRINFNNTQYMNCHQREGGKHLLA